MPKQIKNISVIGDGGWGTTLALYLTKREYAVKLWGPLPGYIQTVAKTRYNSKFLPGIHLPKSLEITADLYDALNSCELIVFAIPSKYTPAVLKQIKKTQINLSKKLFLSVTKGIDTTKLLRVSEIIHNELGDIALAVLSGPTIAIEVAKGIPSTAVIASKKASIAKAIQPVFNSETFRIYTNTDMVGVEFGGSIKNIVALACGVCDGLGFGTNTKAALLTRGLAEMARLGMAFGGKEKTFSGLTGLGDLVTTCFSPTSRNRTVGQQLGQGQSIKTIMASMEMVAEGVETVKAAYKLSQKHKISMPITTEVYKIIYQHKAPSKAVEDLMKRQMKSE